MGLVAGGSDSTGSDEPGSSAAPSASDAPSSSTLWGGLVVGVVLFVIAAVGAILGSGILESPPPLQVAQPSAAASIPIEDEALERSRTILRQLERESSAMTPDEVARMWTRMEKTQKSPSGRDLDEYGVLEVRRDALDNTFAMVISTTRSLCSVKVQIAARADVASLRCGSGIRS